MEMTSLLVGLVFGAALGAGGAALFMRGTAAAARATAEAHTRTLDELRGQARAERDRAEQHQADASRVREELRAAQATMDERERAFKELRESFDRSREELTTVFKATGSDVLKQTAETLLKQAKDQFEGHKQLSQQDLDERKKAIDAVVTPLKEQLAKHEQLVKDLSEKREGDSKSLGEKLKQIAELQQQASTAAQALSSALRDNRQRGQWGEVSLRNIAEMAGLVDNVDFSEQSTVSGADGARLRPDMTVRLPGGRFVPIDAKVPMNAYLDSLDASLSDADRAARRVAHAQALRAHVRALSSRDYAKALGDGVEITVLFVPLESGLIAALEADATIYEEALQSRVIICTSSTLLALLRTCALQWQQAKLNENARRIGDSAKELLLRIGTFAEHLERVGKGLESATKGYNAAVASFNSRLLPGARDTAGLAGDVRIVPEEMEPANTALREVNTRALPAGE
jgi:DNA recombination protein RmuC